MKKRALECVVVGLLSVASAAAGADRDSTGYAFLPRVEIGVRPGYLLPMHPYFKGAYTQEKPAGFLLSTHLRGGFRFRRDTFYGIRYPDAVQGIGIGYHTFFNSQKIGNPFSLYVFQTSSIINISDRLSIDYEWNFGLSYGWRKYDPATNPENTVVGSKANAYIHLGLLLNWQLASSLNLRLGTGVTHFSNGNTKYPNAGVNTVGSYFGFSWDFGQRFPERGRKPEPRFRRFLSYDLVVYGATRKKGFLWDDGSAVIVPGAFAVAGLNFSSLYNVSKYFRAGLSLDAQFDESSNIAGHIASTYMPSDDVKFHRPPFREQFSVGVSARAEIVMPIFSINIGVGRNLLCKGPDTDSFYQIFALKTDVTRNLFIHIGYQLYRFKNPNNLMLGLGWRFNARGR